MKCEALFNPIQIRNMTIRNRVVLPGMTTRLFLDGGYVSDEMIAYYKAIARGGCGLVVVEAASVHKPSATKNFLRICSDEYIPGLKKLADAIQKRGLASPFGFGRAVLPHGQLTPVSFLWCPAIWTSVDIK